MSTTMTVLSNIMIAAVSAWVTVQLSLRRFRAEKWWERRITAYERLIEALYDSKEFSEVHLHAIDEEREVPDEEDKKLRAQAKVSSSEIARAFDLGSFLLTREARERLQLYLKNIASVEQNSPTWDMYLQGDYDETKNCLQDIIDIAHRDLQIQPWLWATSMCQRFPLLGRVALLLQKRKHN